MLLLCFVVVAVVGSVFGVVVVGEWFGLWCCTGFLGVLCFAVLFAMRVFLVALSGLFEGIVCCGVLF